MPPSPFRCECCNAVEYHVPFKLCAHCSQEYRQIRELVTRIRRRLDLWEVDTYKALVTQLNRLVAEVNDLRKKLKAR